MRKVLVMVAVMLGLFSGGSVSAQDDVNAAAQEAIAGFVEAVASGDPAALDEVLAPEFQILRANGVGYDRAGYLASDLPAVDEASAWDMDDVVATADGDVMVVRYLLVISETIDGEPVTRQAPRLTVFRQQDGRWLVAAHANFATPE